MDKDKDKVEGYQLILMFIFGVVFTLVGFFLFQNGTWAEYKFEWSSFFVDVRNVGLVLAGLIGLWFANRRLNVMESQDAKAQRKLDNEEIEKEDKDFFDALKMFGDKESQSLRYAGFLALSDITKVDPKKYYLKVYSILRSFVEEVPVELEAGYVGISRSNYEVLTIEILRFIGKIRCLRFIRDFEEKDNFNLEFAKIEVRGKWSEVIGMWFHSWNEYWIYNECRYKHTYA